MWGFVGKLIITKVVEGAIGHFFRAEKEKKGKAHMFESKKWWQSKTVWGAIATIGASVAGMLGLSVSAEEQTLFSQHAVSIVTALGGLYALYGRLKADKKIK